MELGVETGIELELELEMEFSFNQRISLRHHQRP